MPLVGVWLTRTGQHRLLTMAGAGAVITLDVAHRMSPKRDQFVTMILMRNYRARETGGRKDIRR